MSGLPAARVGDAVQHTGAAPGALIGAGVGLGVGLFLVGTGPVGLTLLAIGGTTGFGLGAGQWLGGKFSGHGGSILSGSPNVSIDGRPAARALDSIGCHAGEVIRCGAERIGINGRPAARKTDATRCAGKVDTGSQAVLLGGPTADVLAERYGGELPGWLYTTDIGLMVVGLGQLGWGLGRGLFRLATRSTVTCGARLGAHSPMRWSAGSTHAPGAPTRAPGSPIKLEAFNVVAAPGDRFNTVALARHAGWRARVESPNRWLDKFERDFAAAKRRRVDMTWQDLPEGIGGGARQLEGTIELSTKSSSHAFDLTKLAHELIHVRPGVVRNVRLATDGTVAKIAAAATGSRAERLKLAPIDLVEFAKQRASAAWTDEGAAFIRQLRLAKELDALNPGVLGVMKDFIGHAPYTLADASIVALEANSAAFRAGFLKALAEWKAGGRIDNLKLPGTTQLGASQANQALGHVVREANTVYRAYPLAELKDLQQLLEAKQLFFPPEQFRKARDGVQLWLRELTKKFGPGS